MTKLRLTGTKYQKKRTKKNTNKNGLEKNCKVKRVSNAQFLCAYIVHGNEVKLYMYSIYLKRLDQNYILISRESNFIKFYKNGLSIECSRSYQKF